MATDEPASYLTLSDGVDVYSSDGQRIGKVEHVLADPETDIFDGIIVDTRPGPGGWRFVDAPDVAEIHADRVVIDIPAAEVESLPEPSANPPTLEHHGVEDTEDPLLGKLRRAWDYLSGNY
jgi:uncharacterized protein YrrD